MAQIDAGGIMKKVLAIIFGIMTVGLTIAVLVVNKNRTSESGFTAEAYTAQYDVKNEGMVVDLLLGTAVDRNAVREVSPDGTHYYTVQLVYDRHSDLKDSGFIQVVFDSENYHDVQYWEDIAHDSTVKAVQQDEKTAEDMYAGCLSGILRKAKDFGIEYDKNMLSDIKRTAEYVAGIGVNSVLIPKEKYTGYEPGQLVLFIGENVDLRPEVKTGKSLIVGLMIGAIVSMILTIVFTLFALKEKR